MPTSTEALNAYVPRNYVRLDLNEINAVPRSVTDIDVDLQQIPDAPFRPGMSTLTKVLIVAAVVTGVVIVAGVAATLGVLLSVTTTKTTSITTTTITTITTETTTTAMAAPLNLVGYRGNNGVSYSFILTGSTSGTIWGTTIYTDDSNLAVAAVHSGFVQYNQTSTIIVTILAGQSSYTATTQNGITSNSYGSWSGSYSIISATG